MDEQAPSTDPVAPEPTVCPQCGAALPVESQSIIQCPDCGNDFFPAIEDEPDAAVEWQEPTESDDELNGLRIRKLVQVRRSAIRARTYALVIVICCLIMGVQLIITDFQEVHGYGWGRWAILYAILAVVMAIGSTIASRKAAMLHRESNISSDDESDHAPEFDELSDGSHRVKNLEEMHNEDHAAVEREEHI